MLNQNGINSKSLEDLDSFIPPSSKPTNNPNCIENLISKQCIWYTVSSHKCDGCNNKKVLISHRIYFGDQFTLLMIHLNRSIGMGKKTKRFVRISDTLDFNGKKFVCVTVIVHLGEYARKGHYYTMVKTGGVWFKCNGITVFNTNEGNITKLSNYSEIGNNCSLVFYEM